MQKSGVIVIACILGVMSLQGCSGSGGGNNAYATTVDTTTKIPASNVILDNTKTGMAATDLQAAIQELSPISLNAVLPNTWSYISYGYGSTLNECKGTITFVNDGSVTYTGQYRPEGQTQTAWTNYYGSSNWSVLNDMVLRFKNNTINGNPVTSLSGGCPPLEGLVVKSSPNKIVVFQSNVMHMVLTK